MTEDKPNGGVTPPRKQTGRKPSCLCGQCEKCRRREWARAQYQALSMEERRELIARRDPEKVRAADRARYYRQREERLALSRRWLENNRERSRQVKSEWAQRNPEKRAAEIKVGNAIRDGRIVRKPCEVCGAEKAEAHHDDYSKPLDVRWLCRPCHARHHSDARFGGKGDMPAMEP